MKKFWQMILTVCCLAVLFAGTAYAAEIQAVMNAYTGADTVTLFVKDQQQQIDQVYIDHTAVQDFTVEDAGPMRTVVMLDNSLSIPQAYREDIKTFLKDLVAARNDGDTFTIATFAQQVNYLAQESSDYLDLKSRIEGITFENQESYFTNALYTIISDIGACEEMRYTRVIVIADGVDNEALGYTDDELYNRITDACIPVYTIGCAAEGNEENLKKMFSLSRMSNAKEYLLGETSGADILQDILGIGISKVTVTPPTESCDGSRRMIRLDYGGDYTSLQVAMPFQAAQNPTAASTPTEEPAVTAMPEPATPETALSQVQTSDESDGKGALPVDITVLVLVAIFVVLMIAAVIAVIMILKKTRVSNEEPTIDIAAIGAPEQTVAMSGPSETAILPQEEEGHPKTAVVMDTHCVKLCLQDLSDPSRTFEYPLRDKVIIGKDPAQCQITIDYDKYISSVHCRVIARDDEYFVQDGADNQPASTNGTFVDEKRVSTELPLPSGAVLKLGQVKFRVTYQ